MSVPADIRWMDAATRFATRYLGTTAQNPTVAAILVDPSNNTLVSRAVTAAGGRPHAETQAIEAAGPYAKGTTLYVTLEPCHHIGKTPPCVEAVIQSGIKRVVIGQLDADPRTRGKSVEKLQKSGLDVTVLKDHKPSALLHRAFFKRVQTGRPLVTAKLAVSKDDMVGHRGEGNVPVTGALAKAWTHTLRSRVDAIAVGAQTAILDNPTLNVRLKGLEARSPSPIVLSTRNRTSLIPLALNENPELMLIAYENALENIAAAGFNHLLVEGGPTLLNAMLDDCLIDEFYLLQSNNAIGSNGLPAVQGSNMRDKLASLGFLDYGTNKLGVDRVTYFQRTD